MLTNQAFPRLRLTLFLLSTPHLELKYESESSREENVKCVLFRSPSPHIYSFVQKCYSRETTGASMNRPWEPMGRCHVQEVRQWSWPWFGRTRQGSNRLHLWTGGWKVGPLIPCWWLDTILSWFPALVGPLICLRMNCAFWLVGAALPWIMLALFLYF